MFQDQILSLNEFLPDFNETDRYKMIPLNQINLVEIITGVKYSKNNYFAFIGLVDIRVS